MDYRYGLINECLWLVRQCNMATKNKLCMETLLYQIKRLLLKQGRHQYAVGAADFSDLYQYEELRSHIQDFCEETCGASSIDDIARRMHGMLTVLGHDSA